MFFNAVYLLVSFFFSYPLVCLTVLADETCNTVQGAIEDASRIRGLGIKKHVPCIKQEKEEVRKFLVQSIAKKIPKSRIIGDDISLKILGFIPENFDYLNGLVDLYTGQLGGYYDQDSESYTLASWISPVMQYPIAIHEYTHALQDQHYDLKILMNDQSLASDTQLAYMSVIEGDAMSVMIDYSNKARGNLLLSNMDDISQIILQNVIGASLAFSETTYPSSLELYLLFPYSSGLNFVHKVTRGVGYKALDDVYKRLPVTSTEILHPDKYPQFKAFTFSESPPADLVAYWNSKSSLLENETTYKQLIHSDTMGEFFISALLSAHIPLDKSTKCAQGWMGDKTYLYEFAPSEDKKTYLLLWAIKWEQADNSNRFFDCFKEATGNRFGQLLISSELGGFSIAAINKSKDMSVSNLGIRLVGDSSLIFGVYRVIH